MCMASAYCFAAEGDKAATNDSADKSAGTEKKKVLNPWVDCGIGAMIFDETAWAAVTSNVIWDLGTTAVTSDQSSQNTCESKRSKTALYIGVTYANLEEETVRGDGPHLRAMLRMLGCEKGAHDKIIHSVRSDFGDAARDPNYYQKPAAAKAENYFNMVDKVTARQYANECHV